MATTNSNRKRSDESGRGGRIAVGFFKVIGTLLLIGVVTSAFLACFGAVYIKEVIMPDAHVEAQTYSTALASTIYYTDQTTGEPVELQSLYGMENRVWISYSEIPKNLIEATIAIEDKRFLDHQGVDWLRTGRAVLSMMTGDDIQGGSTLTQQLLKNMTQYKDVTVKRKIVEIFRALDFEKNHKKDEILELYLNYIYLGQRCYGVATAAENYFGKDVRDLSLAECASLISITNNPSIYNPYLSGRKDDGSSDPDWGKKNNARRATDVVWAMLDQGKISQAEYDAAVAEIDEGLNFTKGTDEETESNILGWYAEQVVRDVIADLKEQYEYSDKMASNMVYSGGLKIYACVDPAVQAVVDEVYLDRTNLPQVSSTGEQLQSAIVVIDHDGDVVAMAGAMGEKTANKVLNMATMSNRQPGSAIKPLAAYAPAIDLGMITPNSVFDDTPVLSLSGSAWPSNSYGYYWGRELVSKAVEQSSNAVAARVVQQLGTEKSYEFLEENFAMSTLSSEEDKGLAQLALGGLHNGVRVIDMAAAYSVFPRNGIYVEPRTYSKVEDADGKVILDSSLEEPRSAVKATTAWYINDMLKDVIASPNGVATGREAYFDGSIIAGKTGSTNDYKDRWFVGYSQYYTAAVWTGYADHPERVGPGSQNPAAQMWKKVMQPIHQELERTDFDRPEELLTVQICIDSGKRASPACALDPRGNRVQSAYFFKGDAPTDYCELHETREVCTASPVGETTGLYHIATEFCPREGNAAGVEPTVVEIALLNLTRDRVNGAKLGRDENYIWSNIEALGTCTVHTEEPQPTEVYDPSTFNPDDPSTYPPTDQEEYKDFDPMNPETWPTVPPTSTPDGGGEVTTPPSETSQNPSPSEYVPGEAVPPAI